MDFSKWSFCFIIFCIGGHLLREPKRREVPRMMQVPRIAQGATLQDTYFIERKCESLKATERDFDKFVLKYLEKNHGISSIALCISVHVFSIRKTSLLTEFYTHYSLL